VRSPGAIVAGRYEIIDRLAAGGMGVVFRARHALSQRIVALKLVHPHVALDPRAAQRFRREASVAAEIGHDGIVQVLDAGVDHDGALFLAMELLEGESLRDRLCREGTTRGEAIALIDAMLDPLAAAHARGFVHRDLKPENVFVMRGERVKLLDFGIAKHLAQESATLTGTAIGTPHYMAPEQVMSAKGATPASDVWSIGVMLYEILSGTPPFTGPTPHAVVVRACVDAHVPIAERAPGIGARLAALIDDVLAKEPADRPRDAAALRDRLRDALAADPDTSREIITMRPPQAVIPTLPPRGDDDDDDDDDDGDGLRSPPAPTPRSAERAWRTIEEPGFTISLPIGWSPRRSSVPGVAGLFVEDASASARAPTTIRLKIEPFDGDTREYVDLGITNLSRVAHVLRTADANLGGLDAVETEADMHAIEPRVRWLSRAAARGGVGYVAQCSASPERWPDVVATLRAILGTLRIR
jgi:serine/threonine protein kinase